MRAPDHCFQQARDATNPLDLTDARTRELYDLLTSNDCGDPTVSYAYELYTQDDHRPVLDAFLLAQTPLDLISTVLKIPVATLATYAHLFLDTKMFRNKLELLSYARNYESNDYGKELVRTAVQIGTDYLLWAYGAPSDVDTRLVVRRTMIDSFFRGMAHKGNALTSGITKEAQKWWGTAIKNAEILEKIDPRTSKHAHDELRIALEGKDETLSVDNAPVRVEDILH